MTLSTDLRSQLVQLLTDVVWPNEITLDNVVDTFMSMENLSHERTIALARGLLESINQDTERFKNTKDFSTESLVDAIKIADEAHDSFENNPAETDPNNIPEGTVVMPTEQWPCFMIGDAPKVQVLRDDAVIPVRAHPTDVGLNITPVHVFKQVRNDTWLLGTGIAIKPPAGFYYDLAGRSSISKTEVMVANACGYIDESYRGDLLIAVTPKVGVDLETFDPTSLLGVAIAQLVLRPLIITQDPVIVDSLDETARGDGSFGSTNDLLAKKSSTNA